MLIINADDWGRSTQETERALECYRAGRITSVSAMVFMADSARAAQLAQANNMDVGLHLNLSQKYDGPNVPRAEAITQERIVRFLTRSKYALLIYNPLLRGDFRRVFESQYEEFVRLYGAPPTHVDGHQHMHLCTNVLVGGIIPAGQKVRRNFSFAPGEKGLVNRIYRGIADKWLSRKYRMTDYFYSLGQCLQKGRLSSLIERCQHTNVEIMTHPIYESEYGWLMSPAHAEIVKGTQFSGYSRL